MIFVISSWFCIVSVLWISSTIAIWSRTDNKNRYRLFSVISFFVSAFISAIAVGFSTGWSTPCVSNWTAPSGTYNIVGFQLIPDDKIHLMIDVPGGPRLCYVPWAVSTAKRIQAGEADGVGSELRLPEFGSEASDGEPQVWPKPPTAPNPEKTTVTPLF